MKNRLIWGIAILVMAAAGAVGASAQVEVSPGVARVSYIHGDVSTQRGDSGDWAAAVLNAPVVAGDKVSTGDDARAEVQFDYANILRMGDHAQATVADITRNKIQVQIGEGIANYDVLKGSEADAEIDTPNAAIHPARRGASLRVIVNSAEESQVIVRDGEVEVSTQQGSTQVRPGEMITVHGAGESAEYKVEEAPGRDDWDSWIGERNHKIESASSWKDTNRYYTGSEDLDAYGHWRDTPDYGRVWQPASADPDWAPYRDGRWVWEPYYGWTWVAGEPWGWAPYHYGRWMYYESSWVWWPGPVMVTPYYRPIWAPAYVSFFGFGGGVGWSVGVGFGSFGWLPLGPGDYCHPWWGGHRDRFNVVNVTNITNINNYHGGPRYGRDLGGLAPLRGNGVSNLGLASTNVHVRGGISSVSAGHFGSGMERPHRIDGTSFRDAHVMTGNLPVVPTRASLSASNRAASPGTMRGNAPQRFFGTTARPANTGSFERQATSLQQSIQRTGQFTPVRSGEPGTMGNRGNSFPNSGTKPSAGVNTGARGPMGGNTPNVGANGGVNSGVSRGTTNGWSRFGSQPGSRGPVSSPGSNGSFNNNVARPGQSSGPQGSRGGSDGWHNFSRPGTSSGGVGNSGQGNGSRGPSSSSPSQRSVSPSYSRPERSITPSDSGRSNSVPRPQGSYSRGSSGDYRPFTPSTQNSGPSNRSYGPGSGSGNNRSYSPPSYSSGSSRNSYSRPPLNMRQPIVGRSSGGSSGGRPSGGYSGGGSHGGGSAPRGGSSGGSHGGGGGSSHGGGSPHGRGR